MPNGSSFDSIRSAPGNNAISIAVSVSGLEVLRLRLDTEAEACIPVVMKTHPAGTSGVSMDAHPPVIAAIRGRDLLAALDAWGVAMRAAGRKPRSIRAFREVVDRAARERGWVSVADLTYDAVLGWLAERRDGGWRGTTYRRNMSCFRSLTKYLVRTRRINDNFLADVDLPKDDGEDGARAATTDEARAIILRAWIRDQADRRCKGARALYWLCLFAAGCRSSEPASWKRRHLVIDHETPHLRWTPEIMKNSKRQDVALAPGLAELLREHLETIARDRARAKLPPAGPDDPVFPVAPTRTTFRSDRDAAGITAIDGRGRGFSPHSARKWFATTLVACGVGKDLKDRLMRHAGSVEARYFDPPLAEQASAVALLPRLWPGHWNPSKCGRPVDNSDSWPEGLTNGGDLAEHGGGTSANRPTLTSVTNRGSSAVPLKCQRSNGLGPRLEAEVRGQFGEEKRPGRVGASDRYETGNADFRPHNAAGLNPGLADLLEVLARLLREGSSGHGWTQGRQG